VRVAVFEGRPLRRANGNLRKSRPETDVLFTVRRDANTTPPMR